MENAIIHTAKFSQISVPDIDKSNILLFDFIYGGTNQKNKRKLQIKQKAAFRAIKRCNLEITNKSLEEELQIDILTVAQYKSTLKVVCRGLTESGRWN